MISTVLVEWRSYARQACTAHQHDLLNRSIQDGRPMLCRIYKDLYQFHCRTCIGIFPPDQKHDHSNIQITKKISENKRKSISPQGITGFV